MAPSKKSGEKKGRSAINEFVTREYTINIHKRICGAGFKKCDPQALKAIRKFAMKEMRAPDGRKTETHPDHLCACGHGKLLVVHPSFLALLEAAAGKKDTKSEGHQQACTPGPAEGLPRARKGTIADPRSPEPSGVSRLRLPPQLLQVLRGGGSSPEVRRRGATRGGPGRQLAAGGRQGSGSGTLAATPSRSARRAFPRPSPRHKGRAASRDPAPRSLPTLGAAHLPHRGEGSRAPPAAPLRPPLPQENAAAGLASCSASCASVPPPPPAAGVSGRRGSRAGREGRGQRQHHHVASRRRPPPTWIPREREGRCSPLPSPSTPRGPKFRESGDPAPRPGRDLREVLATAPARPPPLSPQASGVRGWLLVPSDRGPFPADGFHHHHLKLVGNTVALTPAFRTELLNRK
ncbi:translation initiation factor IF-2-like [Ailuropoda melanoleuca]|uniref:translation initiation factor IF-2-like n=1 Tax=Ailuropoda melanoleuca TaxID=9646 RepID=UPI001494D9FB|nr:translation initiation factor IF-2-like [Ailuropoda melanoleuca]